MELNLKFNQIWQQLSIGCQPILVAVSGGVDSMVLLDLLGKLPRTVRPQIHVATVDHCLRSESQQETDYVKRYCCANDLRFHTAYWPKDAHPDSGVEEAGRHFRYHFFADVMSHYGIKHLLTAHHADDQVETFLMKLMRGGDLRQLCGIRFQRPFANDFCLSRPLLFFSKESLYSYAKQKDLIFFEDQSNRSDDYLRNRVRHAVVPLLKEESPHLLDHLNSYQQQLSELFEVAQIHISGLVNKLSTPDGYLTGRWLGYSFAERNASLRFICDQNVGQINEKQLNEMKTLLENTSRPQGQLDVKGDKVFYKNYRLFGFGSAAQKQSPFDFSFRQNLILDQWLSLSPTEKIGLFLAEKKTVKDDDVLELSSDHLPVEVRHRMPGDKFLSAGGKQKVKKILIDGKIPADQREKVWVVSDDHDDVLWVVGHKKSDLSRQDVNDKIHYIVIYRKISGGKR